MEAFRKLRKKIPNVPQTISLILLEALLFNVDRTRIVRYILNIYRDGELDLLSTCAKNAQVQFEGTRLVKRHSYMLPPLLRKKC